MRGRFNKLGFTLVEILIVITIIGVLTAVIFVNFNRGGRANDLRGVSTELVQQIRFAQGFTTGGNSVDYCVAGTDNQYAACADDDFCNSPLQVDSCFNGVPLGGFGISIDSQYSYALFANTNPIDISLDSIDQVVIRISNISKNIQTPQFKVGANTYSTSSVTLDIIFAPPVGTISFNVNGILSTETSIAILVQSDYISDSCRTISINRISKQINEGSSPCSL